MKKGTLKKALGLGLSLCLTLGLAACSSSSSTKEGNSTNQGGEQAAAQTSIGIIQIVEHPALDAARKGFLDALKDNGYEADKNLTIEYLSAQGEQSNLNSIAQKFATSKHDLILAIATPSAQAMASATTEIPILITAVTDPVDAKLVDSMEKPGGNVTGTTDMNPIKEQIDLLLQLVPNAKSVGVIYNAGEANSEVQVKIVEEVAAPLNIEIKKATVTSSADVLQAAQSLVGKVDAIYVPTDNTVVSAAQSVIQVANENKIPIIAGESSVVEAGGLGTIGINYERLGYQTGEMAVRVLNGANPADMPIESQKDFEIVLNQEAIDILGINVPDDLKSKATIIK